VQSGGLRNTRLELKRRSSPGQPTPNTQPFPHQQQLSSNSFLYPPHSLERKQIKHNNTFTFAAAFIRSHLTIRRIPKSSYIYLPTNQPTNLTMRSSIILTVPFAAVALAQSTTSAPQAMASSSSYVSASVLQLSLHHPSIRHTALLW